MKVSVPEKKINWSAHVEVGNLYDIDNLVALMKWPLDYLQSRGFIESDDPRHCWPLRFPTQEVVRGRPRKLILTIFRGES